MPALLLPLHALLAMSTVPPPLEGPAPEVVRGAKYILHLVVDDLGWADGWGSEHTNTPVMDALADGGIQLNRMYATPMCAPSRSAMFTGRHPASLGYYRNPSEDARLPPDCEHLPSHLKKIGFQTHLVGKWHLPWHSPDQLPSGPLVGFRSFFGYLHWGMDYYTHEFPPSVHTGPVACRGYDLVNSTRVRNANGKGFTHYVGSPGDKHVGMYADQLFATEAMRIMLAHNISQPLYLCVAFQGLHDPYQSPADEVDEMKCVTGDEHPAQTIGKCRNYTKMVTKLDTLIGNLVDILKGRGMYSESVILLHTDNGGALAWAKDTRFGGASSNFPLRGGKFGLYDGGLRVLGLIHTPILRLERRNTTWDGLMYISDVLKTIVGMANGVDITTFRKKFVDKETKQCSSSDRHCRIDVHNSKTGNDFPHTFNLWPAIVSGSESPRKEIVLQPLNDYWHGDHCTEAWVYNPYHPHCGASFLRWPYKLIIGNPGDHRTVSASLSERFTWRPTCEEEVEEIITGAFGTHQARLFNVHEDPGESRNLASTPKGREILRDMLESLLISSQGFPEPTLGSDLSPPPEQACEIVRNTGSWRPWEPSSSGDKIVIS